MQVLQSIFIAVFVLTFTACNQEQTKSVKMVNDPYHQVPTGYTTDAPKLKAARGESREAELELAKMKKEEKLELAKIEAQTQAELKRIEAESQKAQALAQKEAQIYEQNTKKEISTTQYRTEKEIADSTQETTLLTQERDIYLYRIMIAVATLIVIIALLVFYLMHRKNKAVELKLQEDKMKHEEFMQASSQYHEKTSKMLEIIADESTDKQLKKELVRILRYQDQNQNQLLIPTSIVEDEEVVEDSAKFS
jgi:hypothetical protein